MARQIPRHFIRNKIVSDRHNFSGGGASRLAYLADNKGIKVLNHALILVLDASNATAPYVTSHRSRDCRVLL
jgi:hypothetical protein